MEDGCWAEDAVASARAAQHGSRCPSKPGCSVAFQNQSLCADCALSEKRAGMSHPANQWCLFAVPLLPLWGQEDRYWALSPSGRPTALESFSACICSLRCHIYTVTGFPFDLLISRLNGLNLSLKGGGFPCSQIFVGLFFNYFFFTFLGHSTVPCCVHCLI